MMYEKIKMYLFGTPAPLKCPLAPEGVQDDISGIEFEDIYAAAVLARQIQYSFVATVAGQRWRVYPDKSPKLISR